VKSDSQMIDTYIIKLTSRCNLRCTYCYEYSSGDETWKDKPGIMSATVLQSLGARIKEYSLKHGVEKCKVVLHGGEPLLVGKTRLIDAIALLRREADPVVVDISIQTNGVLIDKEYCDIFNTYNICVGISIDGDPSADNARIFPGGKSAFNEILHGIDVIKECAPDRFTGILSVVNTESDPRDLIDFVWSLGPKSLDLLQPFMSHDQAGHNRLLISEKFGSWMTNAMEYWLSNKSLHNLRIRVFEDALQAVLTRKPRTDWFGPRGVSYIVIESDGSYDLLDQLKAVGVQSVRLRSLSRTVFNSSIDEIYDLCLKQLNEYSADILPNECIGCRWGDVCSAGHLPSRYSEANLFNNSSVYCEGIASLLDASLCYMEKVIDERRN
jgi:uncharacterized protein